MKRIKILIFIVLLSVGFLFNGELYMLYLDNFQESCYQANFYTDIPTMEVSDDRIRQDFVETGKKHDVDFFVVDQKIHSAYETKVTIYGTKGALQHLSSMGIKDGKNKSLFFGEAAVHCEAFKDVKDVTKFDTYYFVGDESKLEDIRSFKADLIDQYSGGFPRLMGSERETWLNLLSVWAIIFGLMLMVTLYSILYYKKETMVRIILGESLTRMFARNVLLDTITFSLLFFLIPQFLNNFSNVRFKMSFVFLLLCIYLILNILLHALILRVNYKKDIAGSHDGHGLLRASYLLKVVTTVLVTLVLAGNVVIIRDAYNLYQQKDFFEDHRDYSYYQMSYRPDSHSEKSFDDELLINGRFYGRFQDRALSYMDVSRHLESAYPAVLSNQAAMEEVKRQWPSIAEAIKGVVEGKVYIMVPSCISVDSPEYKFAESLGDISFGYEDYGEKEILIYEEGISLTGIHRNDEYEMKSYQDPIILFNNTVASTDEIATSFDWLEPCDVMYRITTEEWQSFIEEFQLEDEIISKSNVLDVYNHSWAIASRNMRMLLVLSVFLLFLEMVLIMFIIRLEYQFNAVEMALKKVHGYTLLNRNWRILKTTVYGALVGILTALFLSIVLQMPGGVPLVLAGLLMMFLELSYILWRAKRIEKTTISSILKGEKI
ncbi:hypothetical protein [Emergencia timonensis]|uniref:hypothetical protein n=1 Tax=Emergencia timonensis TaxID=1776384 RepID=UPI003991E131